MSKDVLNPENGKSNQTNVNCLILDQQICAVKGSDSIQQVPKTISIEKKANDCGKPVSKVPKYKKHLVKPINKQKTKNS